MSNNLGSRLRAAREKKGWTQVYVAKLLGITSQSLSNYERGERDPDTPLLNKLANLYGVTTDYLLGNETPNQQKDPVEENWPEVLQVLRRSGKKTTAQERKKIAKIIETAIEAITED